MELSYELAPERELPLFDRAEKDPKTGHYVYCRREPYQYPELGNMTRWQWSEAQHQQIADSGGIQVFEKWNLHHDYHHGIGLHATIDVPILTIEAVNAFIDRFLMTEANFLDPTSLTFRFSQKIAKRCKPKPNASESETKTSGVNRRYQRSQHAKPHPAPRAPRAQDTCLEFVFPGHKKDWHDWHLPIQHHRNAPDPCPARLQSGGLTMTTQTAFDALKVAHEAALAELKTVRWKATAQLEQAQHENTQIIENLRLALGEAVKVPLLQKHISQLQGSLALSQKRIAKLKTEAALVASSKSC